jgi:hypothetical protein
VVRTAYIALHIKLGSIEAARRADLWHQGLLPIGPGKRRLAGHRRLRLRRGFEPGGSDLRQSRGVLWVKGVPVKVELELVAYARDVTELALHPFNLRWPVGTKRYEQLATEAIDAIADAMMASVRAPARRTVGREVVASNGPPVSIELLQPGSERRLACR